jgi:hypothetical protein
MPRIQQYNTVFFLRFLLQIIPQNSYRNILCRVIVHGQRYCVKIQFISVIFHFSYLCDAEGRLYAILCTEVCLVLWGLYFPTIF